MRYPTSHPIGRSIGQQEESTTESTQWRTGKEFDRKLKDLQSVKWERMTLGQILEDAETTHGIKIWIDRRVDTSQRISMSLDRTTIGESLNQLTRRCGLEMVYINPLIVIVPQGQGSQFLALRADLRQQVQQLPPALQQALLQRHPVDWPRRSQPDNVLRQAIAPLSAQLQRLSPLPYDVWRSQQLPPLAIVDQLELLSFGFGLHGRLEASGPGLTIDWQDIQKDLPLTCLVDSPEWRQNLSTSQPTWEPQFPDVDWSPQANNSTLQGPLDQVAGALASALQPGATEPEDVANPGQKRFSLRVQAQLAGAILQTIASQTQRELMVDRPETLEKLKQRIDLNVNEVTLEQLFNEVGTKVNVQIRFTREQILVESKE